MKLDYYLTPYTKINSKWIKALNVRTETIKLLEGNVGGKLLDISIDNNFLDLNPKSKATKAKINMLDYNKLKSFCKAREIIFKNFKNNLPNRRKYLQIT